mgnify:CR=1 FL=1
MSETQIPLSMLKPSLHNPRQLAGRDVGDMVASLQAKGMVVPILVRPVKGSDSFEVVDGHRRLAAAIKISKANGQSLDASTAPVQVREMSDDESYEFQIISNLQREGLHYLDESRAFAELVKRGYDVEGIASKIGKPPKFIARRLALDRLIKPVRDLAVKGLLPVETAEFLAPLAEEVQKTFIKQVVREYETDESDGGKRGKKVIAVPPLAEVKEALWRYGREVFVPLKDAPWDLADAGVVVEAGSCIACPKRVGSSPLLFDNVDADTCTDGKCWRTKFDAWVLGKRDQLQNEGKKVVLITTGVYNPPKGVLSGDAYRLITGKPCEQAAVGIVVARGWQEDKIRLGSLRPVCIDPKCKEHWGGSSDGRSMLSPEERQKNRNEKRRQEFEKALRTKQVNAYCEKVNSTGAVNVLTLANFKRVGRALYERLSHDVLKEVARGMGATKEELRDPRGFVERAWKAVTEQTAKGFVMRMTVGDVLFTRWKQSEAVAELEAAMGEAGMAAVQKKLEADVRGELEAKWAKVDGRGKGAKKPKAKPEAAERKGGKAVKKEPKAKKQSGPPENKKVGKKWYF